MPTKIVVVMGATGKTGKLVVSELRRRPGVKVRATTRSLARARDIFPSDVERVEMDLTRPETAEAAFAGAHALYLVPPGGLDLVTHTWTAVQAARAAKVARIVKLGAAVWPGPPLTLERWHGISEEMVAASGAEYTLLRPGWFDQNFTEFWFAPGVKHGLVAGSLGEGRAAWIDCRDIAAVAAAALAEDGHAGKIYTLTGPEVLGIREVVALLSRAAGRTIRYFDLPEPAQYALSRLAGYEPREVAAVMELLRKLRGGWHAERTDDVARVLGRPAIRFEQFAADHAPALRR